MIVACIVLVAAGIVVGTVAKVGSGRRECPERTAPYLCPVRCCDGDRQCRSVGSLPIFEARS